LTHFCWKDRTTGNVEDDLIIFPDDCEFKKIDQCKDGRVFLLKFKSSNRKLFFWLQEPSNDKDEEYCRKVNELLNNPPSAGGSGSGSRGEGNELQYMLNSMSQQQLMQLFGGVGQMGGLSSLLGSINRNSGSNRTSSATPARNTSSSAVAATPVNSVQPATPKAPKKDTTSGETAAGNSSPAAPNPEASRVLLSELQNYLAGINSGAAGSRSSNVDLSTSLTSESINSILSDPERLDSLRAHLPNIDEEGKPLEPAEVKQQLKDTLASPQFQQALSMFSNALQSGQLGPVVSQFKLSEDAVSAANSGDLEQFVKALEKASINDPSVNNDKSNEKENDESKN
jgi:26S proteasome regulatory subunit N13